MKNRPLTYVGAFLLLIVALVVAIGNFKPETKYTTSNPCSSFIKTAQEKVPQEQEKKKYQVSVQFNPIFPDSE
jgi:hypothetical protein